MTGIRIQYRETGKKHDVVLHARGTRHLLVKKQKYGDVDVPITIIRCTPNRNDRLIKHEFISLHRKLMSSRYEVDRIVVSEALCYVGTEQVAGATR